MCRGKTHPTPAQYSTSTCSTHRALTGTATADNSCPRIAAVPPSQPVHKHKLCRRHRLCRGHRLCRRHRLCRTTKAARARMCPTTQPAHMCADSGFRVTKPTRTHTPAPHHHTNSGAKTTPAAHKTATRPPLQKTQDCCRRKDRCRRRKNRGEKTGAWVPPHNTQPAASACAQVHTTHNTA